MNKEEIPVFRWNTKTKEFYVLEHKFDGVNSIEDFINYIHNLDKENKQLKENNMSMQEEMVRTWEKLDDLQQIEQEHQKINGELREENKKYKEVIDKAIEFTNKKWGTWCTHHLEYMTELQNILKEVK